MDIYRLENGVYRCMNNPDNKRKYVLHETKGHYPVLVPIDDVCDGVVPADEKHITCYPILHFTVDDACESTYTPIKSLFSRATAFLLRLFRKWGK